VIYRWRFVSFHCNECRYEIQETIADVWPETTESNISRLEAARAAVTRVRELRAEADERKRLPDVAGMTWGAIDEEMRSYGWHCDLDGAYTGHPTSWPIWRLGKETLTYVVFGEDETIMGWHRRALTYAREIAAKQ